MGRGGAHARSGRVAFPRMKVVPARPARETEGAVALAAERRADVRRSVEFIIVQLMGCSQFSFRCSCWCCRKAPDVAAR
jgi:hypothetical protein